MHPFQRPYRISNDIGQSACEIRHEQGKVGGKFNNKQLKQYKEELQRNYRRMYENESDYDHQLETGNVRQLTGYDIRTTENKM